jgi:undecaprenyl-diphosphatase
VGRRIPFLKHRVEDHLETARSFMQRHGGKSVVIGRFTAALRVMVPGLAGMSGMDYPKFLFFNVLGGVVWGTTFVLVGDVAGQAWERVSKDAGYIGFGVLAIVLLGLIGARLARSSRQRGERVTDRLAATRPVSWFRRSYPRTSSWLAGRVDTSTSRGFVLSLALATAALCSWSVGGLTQDVVVHDEAALWDPGFTRWVIAHRSEILTVWFKAVTWLGSNIVLVPLVIAAGAYLTFRLRDGRAGASVVLALAGAIVLYNVIKDTVARPRPPVALHLVSVRGLSFPSGHATASAAVYGMLAILIARRSSRVGVVPWVVAVAIAVSVGASRIYLGVHWLTDVLAGWTLGLAWTCVLASLLLLWPREHPVRTRADEAVLTPRPG